MADQASQQPTDTTQLTPAPAGQEQNTQNSQQTAQPATQPATDVADNAANQDATATQQQAETETESTQSTEEENELDMQLIDEFGGLQLTLSDPANPGQLAKGQFYYSRCPGSGGCGYERHQYGQF